MKNFIHTANQLGQDRIPFFFLIDFEMQKPQIFPLEQAAENGLFFQFGDQANVTFDKPIASFHFRKTPIEFDRYQQGFTQVQREIQAGNSYLLNLTYPTEIACNYTLAEIFTAASAKYKLYLANQFVCFSPETFIRTQAGKIYSYPMKGTINADIQYAPAKLMRSDKEFSEHNTIVDLIRNDLALVSRNIQVSRYRYLEKVETYKGAIYQTSSEICGELPKNWQADVGSMLAKLLPAGSISGAPKEKTVQIIQQTEMGERGYYTGVFGYFDGEDLESAVIIRYIEQQGERLIFRSGGGITSKSDVQEEYKELLEKVYVPVSAV